MSLLLGLHIQWHFDLPLRTHRNAISITDTDTTLWTENHRDFYKITWHQFPLLQIENFLSLRQRLKPVQCCTCLTSTQQLQKGRDINLGPHFKLVKGNITKQMGNVCV